MRKKDSEPKPRIDYWMSDDIDSGLSFWEIDAERQTLENSGDTSVLKEDSDMPTEPVRVIFDEPDARRDLEKAGLETVSDSSDPEAYYVIYDKATKTAFQALREELKLNFRWLKDGAPETGGRMAWRVSPAAKPSSPKRTDSNVTFNIVREIGPLLENDPHSLELNIVSWNGGEPKFDIRRWINGHEKAWKGIALTRDEASSLVKLLQRELKKGK